MSSLSHVAPGLRCLRAPNPGPLTGTGTNTYLVGEGEVAVIDPGPDMPGHLHAILGALDPGERISQILVTHSHRDHSALAPALAAMTGAPVLGFGDSTAGRSAFMQSLALDLDLGGGEGVDRAFAPDIMLADGDEVLVGPFTLRALWTPGHMGNHLCFWWDGHVFSGDHVMGWATTLVSPPEGDLGAFMASLDRLEGTAPARLFPGHGAPVDDGLARIRALRTHRQAREAAILRALTRGPRCIPDLTAEVYADTPGHLLPAAARNVFAHLLHLCQQGRAAAQSALHPDAVFHLN